jgi:hypothetical protein
MKKKNGSNSAFSAPAASQHVPAQPWPAKKQNQALTLNKEGFRFECFPYVCPEPVLVKIHREFKLEAQIVRFVSLSLPAALISTRAAARHCHRPPVDSRLPRLRLQPPPPRPPPAARIPPKLSPALFVCVPVKKRFGFFELSLCLSRACLGKLIMYSFIISSTGVTKASSSYLRLDARLQLHHPAENCVSHVFLCQSRACLGNVSGLGRKWRFENKSRRLLTAPRGVRRCSRSSRLRRAASLNDAPSFYSRTLARRRPPLLQRQRWPAQLWRAAPPAPPQQPRQSQPRSDVAPRLSNARRRPALPRGAPRARLAAPPLLRDRPRPQRYPPSVAAALTAARPHWRRPVALGCCCCLRRWRRRRLLRERRAGQQWSCSSWASSCRPWAAYPSRCGEAGCSLTFTGCGYSRAPRPAARPWGRGRPAACRRHVLSCLVFHSNHSQ